MALKLAKKPLKNNKAVWELILVAVFAVSVLALGLIFDICEPILDFIEEADGWRLDEVLLMLLFLPIPFGIYALRRWQETRQEVIERTRAEHLSAGQSRILEMVATDQDLATVLEELVKLIEEQSGKALCAVMLLDPNKKTLHVGAAPHLPKAYRAAIEGAEIGPLAGSCGTACFYGKPIYVSDIGSDPLWANYRELALGHNLQACWCLPITASNDRIMGTFAMYYNQPQDPQPREVELIKIAVRIAAVALERKQAQEALHASHERLHVLSQRLVEAQENERRRIARELHDEVGQGLTAVKINLQASRRISGAKVLLNRQIDESITIVEQTIQQVRNISLDLRPSLLDDLGLIAALRWYIDRVAQRSNLKALFTIHLIPDLRLAPDLETTCFRVVQEALTNVVRHAQAQRVTVSLELLDKELLLEVQDDGKGFDTVAARQRAAQGYSLGLLGLEERVTLAGGHFTLESSEMRGTIMRIRFPLPELEVLEEVSEELLERNAV